jgi:hypothetical protein
MIHVLTHSLSISAQIEIETFLGIQTVIGVQQRHVEHIIYWSNTSSTNHMHFNIIA